jgi:hypothetical protein
VSSLAPSNITEPYTTAWASVSQAEELGTDYVWTLTPPESHSISAILAPQEGYSIPLWAIGTPVTRLNVEKAPRAWYDAHPVTGAEHLRDVYAFTGLLVHTGAEITYAKKFPARWLWTPSCTKLPVSGGGALRGYTLTAVQDVTRALNDLAEWTRLPIEELVRLLGASRRSFYNWRSGKQVSKDFRERILNARNILEPIASTRDPILVRQWINGGSPSPASLLLDQRWHELERSVAVGVAPVPAVQQPSTENASVTDESEAYASEVREALLAGFASAKPRTMPRRDTWYPRELTDDTLGEGEDEE